MKKILALALAVLGFTTAQAVTVNWTATNANDAKKYVKETTSFEVGYSLALVLTINSLPDADAQIISVAQWASGSSGLILGSDGKLKFQENNGGGFGSGDVAVKAGDKISVVFTWAYGENANTETAPLISHYADGESVLSVQQTTKAPGIQITAFNEHAAWTLNEATAYTGILTAEEMEYLAKNNTSVVPEPTALALLALGVAGLALKRKNA